LKNQEKYVNIDIQQEEKRAKKYAKRVSFEGATDLGRARTVNDTLEHLTAK